MVNLEVQIRHRMGQMRDDVNAVIDGRHRVWRLIGEYAKTRIKRRTQRGEDEDGRRFSPYSESYAQRRSEGGYSVGDVDLTVSGEMLAALLASAGAGQARLSIGGEPGLRAHGHQTGGGTNVERAFIGLTDREQAKAAQMLMDAIDKAME